jgi:hypothetical protein
MDVLRLPPQSDFAFGRLLAGGQFVSFKLQASRRVSASIEIFKSVGTETVRFAADSRTVSMEYTASRTAEHQFVVFNETPFLVEAAVEILVEPRGRTVRTSVEWIVNRTIDAFAKPEPRYVVVPVPVTKRQTSREEATDSPADDASSAAGA